MGEKSTSYLETEGVARRMRTLFPELKLVAILRNPIDRAISNYLFSQANGFESRPLDQAMRAESASRKEPPLEGVTVNPLAYILRGQYEPFLQSFYEFFPPEAIKLLLYDDLVSTPGDLCHDLYGFLGVDPTFRPPSLGACLNASAPSRPTASMDETLFVYLLEHFAGTIDRLEGLLGRDLDAWRKPSHVVEALSACGKGPPGRSTPEYTHSHGEPS